MYCHHRVYYGYSIIGVMTPKICQIPITPPHPAQEGWGDVLGWLCKCSGAFMLITHRAKKFYLNISVFFHAPSPTIGVAMDNLAPKYFVPFYVLVRVVWGMH